MSAPEAEPRRTAVETTTGPERRTWTLTPRVPGIDLPPGPWDGEPDKIQWIDQATDLDCLMVRGGLGAWCGYVGLPRTHPLHGADPEGPDVDVHGGLNFGARCAPGEPIDGVCHIPEPGREQEPYWLGFDCGHYLDIQPGLLAFVDGAGLRGSFPEAVYRTEEYVIAEVTRLAAQLAALDTKGAAG